MFAGQMACEACNWLLKHYIKEARPQRKYSTFRVFGNMKLTSFLRDER
jgi:hypothetical protein